MRTHAVLRNAMLFSLFLFIVLAIASCGGGGSGGMTGTVSGPITTMTPGPTGGVASITVGTRTIGTTHTSSVKLDGDPGKVEDLEVGEVVIVKFETGDMEGDEASEIEAEHLVTGSVDNVATASNALVVLGQKVFVDNTTLIREGDNTALALAAIHAGDVVRVSGMFDANGDIQATRIDRKPQGVGRFDVKGKIRNLDGANRTFDLGAFLHVDFSNAKLDDLPMGGLAEGLFVEAKAPPSGYNPATFTLAAEKVEAEEGIENELEEGHPDVPPAGGGMGMM